MAEPRETLLLVEDDESLAAWITDYLSLQGYRVVSVNRGDLAIQAVQAHSPDLVLLDLMLPGKSGMVVCGELRSFYQQPILMMTASVEESDEVDGLGLGADDYLVKPLKPRILLARITALLRRNSESASSNIREFGALLLDANAKSVSLDDHDPGLSANDFEILWLLSSKAGKVFTRSELISQIRGFDYDGFDRSIDIRISRLRRKLGDDSSNPTRIKTIRGKGYLFVRDAW